jgi:hypothetical protein
MSDKVERLKDSFRVFIDSFVTLGLDYQIGVTTTDMDDPTMQGRLQGIGVISPSTTTDVVAAFASATDQGSAGSTDEKGLAAARAALSAPLITTTNAGLVRDDAQLAIVVVSDEDDSSGGRTADFVTWLNNTKGGDPARSSFSVVGGGRGLIGCTATIGGTLITASGGPRYPDVADATGGMTADICALDFDEVLEYLSYAAAGLITRFPLEKRPNNIGAIKVWIDGAPVPYHGVNGWTWIPAENAIEFHGTSVPGPTAIIDVSYPVPSECR